MASPPLFGRRMTVCVAATLVLLVLSLTFPNHDAGAVLCFGITFVSALALFAFGVTQKVERRLAVLVVVMAYVLAAMLLMWNYSLSRDYSRWLFLWSRYKPKVLAQPSGEGLQHVEWDGWGFAGISDTTSFLVVWRGHAHRSKPRSLPCEVLRVSRLGGQWYAVLFYSEMCWGQGDCK
jgi:hypothetical protein